MHLKRKRSSDFDLPYGSFGGSPSSSPARDRLAPVAKRLRDSATSFPQNNHHFPSSHDATMFESCASPPSSDSSEGEDGTMPMMTDDMDMMDTCCSQQQQQQQQPSLPSFSSRTPTTTTTPTTCLSCGDHLCRDCSASSVIGLSTSHQEAGDILGLLGRCVLCAESESLETMVEVAGRLGGGVGWTGFTKGNRVFWRLELAGRNPCLGALWAHGREAW